MIKPAQVKIFKADNVIYLLACPVSCTICDSPNGCQECIYNLARLLDTDQSSFTTKINEGSLDCTQHESISKLYFIC